VGGTKGRLQVFPRKLPLQTPKALIFSILTLETHSAGPHSSHQPPHNTMKEMMFNDRVMMVNVNDDQAINKLWYEMMVNVNDDQAINKL
jgi:hypothetical protein